MSATTKKFSELQLKQLQLNSLLQITEAINQNFSKAQLVSIYEFVVRTQLKIDKLLLFTFDEDWQVALSYGLPENYDTTALKEKIKTAPVIKELSKDYSFEGILPVYHKSRPLAFTFIGKVKNQEINYKDDILPFVQTITNLVIVALENKKLARENIKQAGIKKEMALAAQMQSMLFPEKLPHFDNVDMTALYLPHQEVGGDYYDYIRVNESEFIMCMADVSGKGVPAALLMSNFQATLHALSKNCKSLKELVQQLNESVTRSAKGEKFITLFICKFNTQNHQFEYINAGHNPPILFGKDGLTLLEEGSVGLGMFDELPFLSSGLLTAEPDSEYLLTCYTDGIVELENKSGDHYGMERLKEFVLRNANVPSMSVFKKRLLLELNEFREEKAFIDDVTLLACRCRF